MTGPDANTQDSHPVVTTRPLLGVAGVLLGALIATCTGRLMSVGLADIRGALHLGVDEGSWINTTFNASMMFIGPFSVYLGGLLGPRRVLLACAWIFTAVSFLIPFCHSLEGVIALLIIAGLSAGTFYPLTLSFVLRSLPMRFVLLGIAMYATDIIFTTDMAQAWESFFIEHLSWHWIFWNGTILTPIMIALVHFGIPWQPLPKPQPGHPAPNWRGFLYASLGAALLYTALDQGQRLDWFHSPLIIGLVASGALLIVAAIARHFLLPNPLVNYQFLMRKNTLLLAPVLISFRFIMLATVVTIPGFLGSVRGFLPLQEASVMAWVALPQFVLGVAAMALMRRIDPRLILTAGFGLVGVACLLDARVTSVWAGLNFGISQAVMAVGLALAFNSMVGAIVLEIIDTGGLTRPADVLTFAGFFQVTRLFGGEMGSTFMGHFIAVREEFHSNMLGQNVQLGNSLTDSRLLGLQHAFAPHSTGLTAMGRGGSGAAGSPAGLYVGNLRQLSSPGYMLCGVPCGGFLHVQSANPVSAGHCCTSGGQMRNTLHERRQSMTSASAGWRELRAAVRLCLPLALLGSAFTTTSVAQQSTANPMQLTLERAINLALKQNHSVHLRGLSVEQMQSRKDEARSNYLPQLKASGSILHVTELEGVEIPVGAFGSYQSTGPVPAKSLVIDQGGLTGYMGGVGLEQPITQLFRIHQANIAAKQDLLIARTELDQTQDAIALQVRQLYYNILINQQKLKASQDQLAAAQIKDEESRNDVARGNALEILALQSKAAILQAQQDSLTFRLQGNDLQRQLADVLGLTVDTPIDLDPGAAAVALDVPTRADAIRIALEQNQDLRAARQTLVKAQAGLAAAKDAYLPDVTALSRYSYQSGVPFLVHNFGTFGFSLSYNLFDGGRREARVREARSGVRSAEVVVDKLQSEIEVQVQGIYDRVDELRQMVDVAGQVVKVRTEAARLADRQFEQTAALSSARSQSHADLTSATASLLETNCGLSLAEADLKRAIGQMPQ